MVSLGRWNTKFKTIDGIDRVVYRKSVNFNLTNMFDVMQEPFSLRKLEDNIKHCQTLNPKYGRVNVYNTAYDNDDQYI